MTLRELTGALQELYALADTEELDVTDTLDLMEGEYIEKVENYVALIRQISADSVVLKEEIDRLTARYRTLQNNADRLKSALMESMIEAGKEKIKTTFYNISVRGYESVVVDDPAAIPEEFLKYSEPTVNKVELKKALKEGEVSGAHLESKPGITIR